MQEIITREISATQSVVITVGKFQAGSTHNVIPEQAVLEGTIRYLNVELGDFIYQRMEKIVTSTGEMFRGEAKLEVVASVPPLTNDKELGSHLFSYVKDVVGEQSAISFEGGGMGSEDFASYCYKVPSVYFLLGAGTKEEDPRYGLPMHHPQIVFNEDILPTGAAIHAYSAMMWLKSNT